MTSAKPLDGCRILLVEDSYTQAVDTSEWLIEAGAEIVGPAANVDKARALIAESKFDLAVLDLNLGEGANYEIAASLADQGVPFVLATGYDKYVIDARFEQAPHVSKPVSRPKLLNAILTII